MGSGRQMSRQDPEEFLGDENQVPSSTAGRVR